MATLTTLVDASLPLTLALAVAHQLCTVTRFLAVLWGQALPLRRHLHATTAPSIFSGFEVQEQLGAPLRLSGMMCCSNCKTKWHHTKRVLWQLLIVTSGTARLPTWPAALTHLPHARRRRQLVLNAQTPSAVDGSQSRRP